ncbi:interferon-induced very large GTPase 1-like [Electrophorus electricus]|uniref:interferon-induced very large GTPase 1-like n=1 Tax=Electrophorus electricus TaxID=8005 RepID=UPI0015D0AE29|nr:interferon-induced very large GTPase 1-like [Electrophorus electricus]
MCDGGKWYRHGKDSGGSKLGGDTPTERHLQEQHEGKDQQLGQESGGFKLHREVKHLVSAWEQHALIKQQQHRGTEQHHEQDSGHFRSGGGKLTEEHHRVPPREHLHTQQQLGQDKGGSKAHRSTEVHYQEDESSLQLTGDCFHRLGLEDKHNNQLTRTNFLELSPSSVHSQEPSNEKELVHTFMQRLLTVDYKARHIINAEPTIPKIQHTGGDVYHALFKKKTVNRERKQDPIHPMDVQMAVFLCADHFLRQTIVTKLQECQYALPLLVPNPFTGKIEFPLWTMRQISKSWKRTDPSHQVTSRTMPMYKAETPMVAFFRFGSVSSSKSQLMNSLINERHNTFFHRHCPGSSRNRLLMDGVVEITWYLPSGKSTDHFPDCVAFCNLHGDSSTNATQRKIVTEIASTNVVFLPKLDENDNNMAIVQELYNSPKPLIVILTDEEDDDEDAVCEIGKGKYRMGLRGRNHCDVSDALRSVIKNCLLRTSKTFRLENMTRFSELSLDEHNQDCQRGKEAAKMIMGFLERKDPTTVKETYLPYQGKLWHAWCQKNKDLRRLQSINIEIENSRIQNEMIEIRCKQQAHEFSKPMQGFVGNLDSLSVNEKMYFLKWIRILLDEFTSNKISDIHQEYDKKWAEVLALKKDKLKVEQSNLENISNKLNATTFGLEHMLREMGQIYEASISENRGMIRKIIQDFTHLPRLAAELMRSGIPMELMDGDAGHVPLIWVSAVLDELIKILGDQRVFVLSVLGIQSSGKSTMLNAMFGLQFAVSAGRCTRGAFMQMVKVSEEMKTKLKFDYILVVDTEGLRALELAGRATIHHDNELATFVVGLGNMTLMNIFGENPAEMQDILQIVVHAFMRMKKVRLNSRCIFVHQNVSDVAAREKIMEGRRRLQETLDKMTRLSAKEEMYDAECFSDVIAFDVQKDVKYFAQLWEGSPPMAPPNPCYSENVRELKKDILSYASHTHGIKLSQFRTRVKDLWNALLNENFVFSFKNAQEISVYRKLEEEYEKWTWTLRSAMLSIEDKMFNRVACGTVETIDREELKNQIAATMENVQKSFKLYFEEDDDKETLIQWKSKFDKQIQHLHEDLINEAKRKLEDNIKQTSIRKKLDQQIADKEKILFEKCKELALKLKENGNSNNDSEAEFEKMWGKWVSELHEQAPKIKDMDMLEDVVNILGEIHESALVHERKKYSDYKNICSVVDYNKYVLLKKRNLWERSLKPGDQKLIQDLILKVTEEVKIKVNSFPFAVQGYNPSYIQDIARDIKKQVQNFDSSHQSFDLKKEFVIDLSLFVFEDAKHLITELHGKFKEANDPFLYLDQKQIEYFKVFEKYWQGATSAAVLGEQICHKLKQPIKQSVYNMMATYVCGQMRGKPPFNGNRADLEKYILRSLAEQKGDKNEKFKKYLKYMFHPRSHFEIFIQESVEKYMRTENLQAVSVIKEYLEEKERNVISAAKMATHSMIYMNVKSNADTWLKYFSNNLVDELGNTNIHTRVLMSTDITDYDLLVEVIQKELSKVVEELKCSLSKLSSFRPDTSRERPDEILIKHFCRCCWEQCPFCGAVCTNSQQDHTGDHNADFHRSLGMNGQHYKDSAEFCIDFCTTLVASNKLFWPSSDPESTFPYKEYRRAGGTFAKWGISTDFSELAYWKWFICEFQENLEKHHNKTFYDRGKIPDEWKYYNQIDAVASLDIGHW